METITDLIRTSRPGVNNAPVRQQRRLNNSLTLADNDSAFVAFCTRYAPGTLPALNITDVECVMGDYPALSELNIQFANKNAGTAYLLCHINNINEYAGTDKKMDVQQRVECAATLYELLYHLKVTEVMLFFQRFKSGRYGKFYGAVDPMIIGQAAWQFLTERNRLLEKAEAIKQREHERDEVEHADNCITRDEYRRLCELQTTGDPYAFQVETADEIRRYFRYFYSKLPANRH